MNRSINITQPNPMPHLTSMVWDYLDQLQSASNGAFTSYYNYDAEGNRTRKVVVKNNIIETRYYINGYELYRKEIKYCGKERDKKYDFIILECCNSYYGSR